MLRRLRAVAGGAAVAAAAVLVVAGCGGGSEKAYSAEATEACLERAGLTIIPVDGSTDVVASSALGGSVSARLSLNKVTIAFGRSAAEGTVIEKAYATYGSQDIPIDQVLERRRNAVLLWAGVPTLQDGKVVRECLKS